MADISKTVLPLFRFVYSSMALWQSSVPGISWCSFSLWYLSVIHIKLFWSLSYELLGEGVCIDVLPGEDLKWWL